VGLSYNFGTIYGCGEGGGAGFHCCLSITYENLTKILYFYRYKKGRKASMFDFKEYISMFVREH